MCVSSAGNKYYIWQMVLSLERVNSLEVEIDNLKFKKEIFEHRETNTDTDEYRHELEAREAQIAGLRGHLEQLISSLPETE